MCNLNTHSYTPYFAMLFTKSLTLFWISLWIEDGERKGGAFCNESFFTEYEHKTQNWLY